MDNSRIGDASVSYMPPKPTKIHAVSVPWALYMQPYLLVIFCHKR